MTSLRVPEVAWGHLAGARRVPVRPETARGVQPRRHQDHVLTVAANEVSAAALAALLTNKVSVLHVKSFAPQEACRRLTEYFWSGAAGAEQYSHEVYDDDGSPVQQYFGVDRIGVPFNSTYGKPIDGPEHQRYRSAALPTVKRIRAAVAPLPTPIDMLRLLLDELHPTGAHVAALPDGTGSMFAGIGRLMTAEHSQLSAEQPHFDALPPAASGFAYALAQQFAANVYLDVPAAGGELEIWPVAPLAFDDIEASEADRDWRAELGAQGVDSVKVQPGNGDLLLFNTRRPHAITSFSTGRRTSMQCFIGMQRTAGAPLVLWN